MKTNQEKVQSSTEKPSSTASKAGDHKCILIYEDDREILFLCKMLLERENYRVETLMRCENVIKDIEEIKPDLILMDLWIPEIGGEKALNLIKENAATLHIPVLLFSANAKIKEISEKANADGYIEKPFDIHAFKEKIAQHI